MTSLTSLVVVAGIVMVAIIGTVIGIVIGVSQKKKKAPPIKKVESPFTLDGKIMALNSQLAAGVITREQYEMQKAELLRNI